MIILKCNKKIGCRIIRNLLHYNQLNYLADALTLTSERYFLLTRYWYFTDDFFIHIGTDFI